MFLYEGFFLVNFNQLFKMGLVLDNKNYKWEKTNLKSLMTTRFFANVIEPSRDEVLSSKFDLKGNWSEQIFKNKNPIVLELGCGKGEYSVDLAKRNPDKNFIGVDIKGARFWHGAKIALDEDITNVRFLRTQIELIENCFERNEISEIWITFPDPQIKYKREKHRLTNPEFLAKYKNNFTKRRFCSLKDR